MLGEFWANDAPFWLAKVRCNQFKNTNSSNLVMEKSNAILHPSLSLTRALCKAVPAAAAFPRSQRPRAATLQWAGWLAASRSVGRSAALRRRSRTSKSRVPFWLALPLPRPILSPRPFRSEGRRHHFRFGYVLQDPRRQHLHFQPGSLQLRCVVGHPRLDVKDVGGAREVRPRQEALHR